MSAPKSQGTQDDDHHQLIAIVIYRPPVTLTLAIFRQIAAFGGALGRLSAPLVAGWLLTWPLNRLCCVLRGGVLEVGPNPFWPSLQSGHEDHGFLHQLLTVLADGGKAQMRLEVAVQVLIRV